MLALLTGSARAEQRAPDGDLVEVVVALSQKPLATTRWRAGRQLQARTLANAQASVARQIEAALPAATIRWRYKLVANGMAVVVPRSQLARLRALPGVETIYPSVRYRTQLDRSPQQIGAPALWGPGLTNAGQGMKIAVIDEGIDQTHAFFSPAGYTMPPGFPKGQTAYTTAKVIVARAFPPASPTWKHASKPFDPELSSHGTHVAGIAAGNANTLAEGVRISGVAPRAYLGNYKALTIPTDADVGLDGNSPELVAAIEAAVADGMDVINMSLGEPEIEPSRDIVVKALGAAARAGVVPVVSAGNDFDEFGRGSVGSPGATPEAITVGAVTTSRGGPEDVVASFSSSGPTPLSLQLKPDVSAPGVGILSAAPRNQFVSLSGTSKAAPHVAGAVALLLQKHPTWTPAQVKSALALTGDPAYSNDLKAEETQTLRGGGGVIDLPRADATPVFASPVSLSFGLLRANASATRSIDLTDSGNGGSGAWTVGLEQQSRPTGAVVQATASVTVPGRLDVTVRTTRPADGEATGFVVLTRGADRLRIPYWFGTGTPALASAKRGVLRRPGVYKSTTKGGSSRVTRYRYPERPIGFGFAATLPGPERVFRVTLKRPAANFGVVLTSRNPGVRVEPRIVKAGDERRLTGYAALPFNLNPYLRTFGELVLAAGTILPAPGSYDVVFDSPSAARAGAFAFRYWVNDVSPPSLSLRTRTVTGGTPLVLASSDRGSGVDPASVVVRIDGDEHEGRFAAGRVTVATGGLAKGRHQLRVQISDYQESRNMENVGRILPNTRILETSFVVR
ncbi:MAG: S8 family serine peptidase [Thermoleophilia bacterium]|nr:S8 family serine peptidase [Thermoleophilia bacterium]